MESEDQDTKNSVTDCYQSRPGQVTDLQQSAVTRQHVPRVSAETGIRLHISSRKMTKKKF